MRVRLIAGSESVPATLYDNPTAADLASLLPVSVDMRDLFGREKAGPLARGLVQGARAQSTFEVGDLGYWSPNGDLAVYYNHDGATIPTPGIIMVGRLDDAGDVGLFADVSGPFVLRIEVGS